MNGFPPRIFLNGIHHFRAKKTTTAAPSSRRRTNVSLQPTIDQAFSRKRQRDVAVASATPSEDMLNQNEFAGYSAPPVKRTVFGHLAYSTGTVLSLSQSYHQRVCVGIDDRENHQPNLRVAAARDRLLEDAINPTFRCRPPADAEQLRLRESIPILPEMQWTDSNRLWNLMCWKEEVYQRDSKLWQRHLKLNRNMRMVLLDWMMEVCEIEKLHRETYYLSIDLFDRYMSKARSIGPDHLQLAGVTALFIAAKIEEIYPPKIERFAYMTDGACNEDDIRLQELVMLKQLNWALSPVTAVHWLTIYLQLLNTDVGPRENSSPSSSSSASDLTNSRFERIDFLNLVRVLDLCMMDVKSAQFPYGVLAASVVYSTYDKPDAVLEVTGYKRADLVECCQWMKPFLETCCLMGEASLQLFEDVAADDSHNIQTRIENVDQILARVEKRATAILMQQQSKSPEFARKRVLPPTTIYPTPPPSNERPYPLHRPPNTIS
uniref:Cyclin N-terminal domain-containing protein n=1 Tax=Plectus sambesii TaxID=2011161 RepID=A0A914WK69_9BILA